MKWACMLSGILLVCVAQAAQGQMLVNSNVALADGTTLTVKLLETGVQQQNGDAFNAYVEFGDIKGESTQDKHKDWIELIVFPGPNAGSHAALIQTAMTAALAVGIGTSSIDNTVSVVEQVTGQTIKFKHAFAGAVPLSAAEKQAVIQYFNGLTTLAAGANNYDFGTSLQQALGIPAPSCITLDGP